MLSVSATFAADDTADAVAIDEIDDGEPLAVDEDSQSLSEGDVVTKDNFNSYFDKSGKLLDNVTATELTFKGEISDVGTEAILLDRPIKISGDNSTFNGVSIAINARDVVISDLTINQNNSNVAIAVLNATNVQIEKTTINFTAMEDDDGCAIAAKWADDLKLIDNTIMYTGTTNGTGINNGIYISESNNAVIRQNKFILNLVSCYVPWIEIPAGSGNWVSSPVSEGIVIDSSNHVSFQENDVAVNYTSVSGAYDTIYTIDFKNVTSSVITDNNIVANGHTYIYGIILSGDDFLIMDNVIKTESDNYYANGIDIEGPAAGTIHSNEITAKGVMVSYPIYSGMNAQNATVTYFNNTIKGEAYFVLGMSLGDVESSIAINEITLEGNYTTGIAFNGDKIDIAGNRIILTSSEQGNESLPELFGIETNGIKIINGDANIVDNIIATPGKGIHLRGNVSADIEKNFINVVGNVDKDAYAIYALEINELNVSDNDIDYQGMTNGTGINNAVYIFNATASILNNKFTLDLVSCYVPWTNWVSHPISEGIVVEESNKAVFRGNDVNVTYGDVYGNYDTIYAIDFINSDETWIAENKINAHGHTYIYGILVSGNDFLISDNEIYTESDNYYANGIDVEGPSMDGVIGMNNITAKGVICSYPIYTNMNDANVTCTYVDNNIKGEAYFVLGMSIGDYKSAIMDNEIMLDGNYTTGIAYRGTNIDIERNKIVLLSSEVGNESVWEGFGVESAGIKVIMGEAIISDNVIATAGKGVALEGPVSANVENNFINVVGNTDKDAYAIYAKEINALKVISNEIDYQGTTNGTGINNAFYVLNTTGAVISKNKFTLDLVSCYVPWKEIPSGSGNWVSFPVSEGIVIEKSSDATFNENEIEVTYGDVSGSYDTIYAVDFKNSDNALIKDNTIHAEGHTYIYGIIISGMNFTIDNNDMVIMSDNFYANGIDVEGPATGVIFGNEIHANGVKSAYPIYSGMNGQNVSVNYTNNDLYGKAYLVIGMSLGDVESNIVNNCLYIEGNYTKGIASKVAQLSVISNLIESLGSNVGNESAWEAFGVDTYGIKVTKGDAFIANNTIASTSDYAVYMAPATTGSIANNTLVAKNMGRNAICLDSVIAVSGSGPDYKTILLTTDVTKAYNSATQFVVTAIDENGAPIAGRTLVLTMGVELVDVATTNAKGVARFNAFLPVGSYNVKVSFDGDDTYGPKEATGKIVVTKAATKITAAKKTFKVKTKTKQYTVAVKANNKALAKAKVTLKVNGKIYKATTNANGKATFKITKLNKKGKYKALVKFAGTKSYKASSAISVITVK